MRGHDGRWCGLCWTDMGKIKTSSTKYANAYGIHNYKPQWSQSLRLVARFAFACVRMLPMDVRSIFQFRELAFGTQWPWPCWEGFVMAIIMVAAAMKWPFAITAFAAALSSISEHEAGTPEVALASCILTAVEAFDGMPMEVMHKEISKTGRAGCQSGLIWMLRRLGFIDGGEEEDDDDEDELPVGALPGRAAAAASSSQTRRTLKKRKSAPSPKPSCASAKQPRAQNQPAPSPKPSGASANLPGAQEQPALSPNEFRLGKLQLAYKVECGEKAIKGCRRLIDEASAVPALPAAPTARDARAFCDAVTKATRQAFGVCAKDTNGYTYKTIARKIIVVFAEPGGARLSASGEAAAGVRLPASGEAASGSESGFWDSLRMDEIAKWMPDEDETIKPLNGLTGAQARKMFAMSPPWISCFACYMLTLMKDEAKVHALMQASSIDILCAIEKFQSEHGFSPSIETVASQLIKDLD